MSAREGPLDPLSGQRAAFPLSAEDDSSAANYLLSVRAEAEDLAIARALSRKRGHGDIDDRPNARPQRPQGQRPAPPQSQALDYDAQPNAAEIARVTVALFNGAIVLDRARGIAGIFDAGRAGAAELDPMHPAECTSQASWKAFMLANDPIPVDHVDTFRLYKYLARWLAERAEDRLIVWAWALLLRTPAVVDGDDMALLRDVARALRPLTSSQLASAFVYIVGTQFGQRDLVN